MLGGLTNRVREIAGTYKCMACGASGHYHEMHKVHDGLICSQCLYKRVARAKAAIQDLEKKGLTESDACLIRKGRKLLGGSHNTEHIIEYNHRYICEHCGHFGHKNCSRIVNNSGQFHNSPSSDMCDECGSSRIWYIDVDESDITKTHDRTRYT